MEPMPRNDDEANGADSERPWEQPGAVRRDCEPHRGLLLLVLGHVGWICGFVVLLPACLVGGHHKVHSVPQRFLLFVIAPLTILMLSGLSLSLLAWMLSRRDLEAMAAGRMDLAGEDSTQKARRAGLVGLCFFALNAASWLLLFIP